MRYDVGGLVRDVRTAMDFDGCGEKLAEIEASGSLMLDGLVESKLADAARAVERSAPVDLLDSGRAFGETVGWESRVGYGCGWVQLPDDFLRLVCFRMSDWSRSVTEAVSEDDAVYQMQRSRYAGIRGNPQRPVVAITRQPIGLVLEFYSCTGGEGVYIRRARYIPIPRVVGGKIELCEKLRPAIVYYAAYMTALSLNEREVAENMLNLSKELMR
ncbi:MAG: hypothetical protein ACI4OZ_09150 [Akkermansia sp.]